MTTRAGTVLIKSTNGDDTHYDLRLDNQDRGSENSCDYPTYLDQDGNDYSLDQITLNQRACIRLKANTAVSGELHVTNCIRTMQ